MARFRYDLPTLGAISQRLRRDCVRMTTEAGSGHPTSCLSSADLVSALFFHAMDFDPGNPWAREGDLFVLSKGHAAPLLYAALHAAGAIGNDLLMLRKLGSPLEGHPVPRLPWVRAATGSLGQGLSVGCGLALARRMDGRRGRVYCLLGDGEVAEGSVWEAAQFASVHAIENLCAIVDVNALGQSGPTVHTHNLDSLAAKFAAFGWKPLPIDGHNLGEIVAALGKAAETHGRPTAILARTLKGKGIASIEGKPGWHGKPIPKGEALEKALAEIGDPAIPPPPKWTAGTQALHRVEFAGWAPPYRPGESVATREAYGNALVRLGKALPQVVVLDGDVKNSTYAEKFLAAYPDRYFECYIAEQNMVGTALGFAADGKIPFASSFACFLTRAYDQIRMAAYSRPPLLVLCGSHVGVSIGEDGPSQMGLEDIAMMRAIYGSSVLYPCDAVSAEACVQSAARAGGIVYLRTSRPKTPVIYDAAEPFPIGGAKVLRKSERDAATVVAAGVTVHEALKAYEVLKAKGTAARVIDAYSVKPLDSEVLRRAAKETARIVVVEDHAPAGGLGEAVAEVVSSLAPVDHLAVREIPISGRPEELLERHGISAAAIVKAVTAGRTAR